MLNAYTGTGKDMLHYFSTLTFHIFGKRFTVLTSSNAGYLQGLITEIA